MWNCGRKGRRRVFTNGEGGDRRCVLCLRYFVTEEEDEVIKNKEGLRGSAFVTREEKAEQEGCGDSGPHKIHENERRTLLEYEGKE